MVSPKRSVNTKQINMPHRQRHRKPAAEFAAYFMSNDEQNEDIPMSEYLDDSPILPRDNSPIRLNNIEINGGSFMEQLDLKKNTTMYLEP